MGNLRQFWAMAEPAPNDRARKQIALVYDYTTVPILPDIQHGALMALRGTEWGLGVWAVDSNGPDLAEDFTDFLERQRPAGVILPPPLSEIRLLTRLARQFGCEPVCLGMAPQGDPAQAVSSGDRKAAAETISWLIAQGHERIGMVAGPEDSRIAQERELGYLDAMADHDLDRGPALIINGDNSFVSGFKAGKLLLEVSPRPTAIFAANDEMAAGVLQAAVKAKVAVPGALSVVGFEDTALAARLCPQLASVHVPLAEMAQAAALLLIAPGANSDGPANFESALVKRASAGPCPAPSPAG